MAFVSCLCLLATLDNFLFGSRPSQYCVLILFCTVLFVYLLVMLTTSFGEIKAFQYNVKCQSNFILGLQHE